MVESDQPKHGFGDPEFSWREYEKYRPTYPASLWSLVLSHHEANHAKYNSALDLGCGSGAAAATLAKHFSKVSLADPSEHNLNSAKARMASADISNCKLEYHMKPAEESVVPPASQDMITMFEAIHWTDASLTMAQAAQALKPGGIIAIVHYTPRCRIVNNLPADRIWNELCRLRAEASYRPDPEHPKRAYMRAMETSNIGLDYVPLDADLWKPGGRRILINCEERGVDALRIYEGNISTVTPSKVIPGRELVEEIKREPDWNMLVDPGYFEAYTLTLQGPAQLPKEVEAESAVLWRKLYEVLDEGPKEDGKVRIIWPAAVVLATRK